ncbi:MAG: putative amino acid racemase [Clostridiaceae bacterium]|jgi:predicted amino acid racemase|nr:putative amino acid racemase [Clostridiaceae bacterium]
MFLNTTLKRNTALIDAAFEFHQKGIIEPDTYILDSDAIIENGSLIKNEADKYGIKLYFMTKQLGRNPYIAKELMNLGYDGAVAVDFREAEILYKAGIKIGHAGHLVQIPNGKIEPLLKAKPEVITVYSIEKAKQISIISQKLGIIQNIMLRVIGEQDIQYAGQHGGFLLNQLEIVVSILNKLPNIKLSGVTSFPCFLYDEKIKKIKSTNNINTLKKAQYIIENIVGYKLTQINTPSATCCSSINLIAENGGTHGEPGHGLLGTTPLHAVKDEPEKPAIVYVSEISHNFAEKGYCFGGGHYRRSHVENALVGKSISQSNILKVKAPDSESIDYYFELSNPCNVGNTVIMSFRSQIFVTRSKVAIVKGISKGNPQIVGIYDSQGNMI